ncbi:hypothetical protein ACWEKM_35960 [Streptomyces sp. NPDC004752]
MRTSPTYVPRAAPSSTSRTTAVGPAVAYAFAAFVAYAVAADSLYRSRNWAPAAPPAPGTPGTCSSRPGTVIARDGHDPADQVDIR